MPLGFPSRVFSLGCELGGFRGSKTEIDRVRERADPDAQMGPDRERVEVKIGESSIDPSFSRCCSMGLLARKTFENGAVE